MNDNCYIEGPAHAAALGLINDLMLILANAEKHGLDRYSANGEKIYDFGFWSDECAKVLGLQRVA